MNKGTESKSETRKEYKDDDVICSLGKHLLKSSRMSKKETWIIDSGATVDKTFDQALLENYSAVNHFDVTGDQTALRACETG